MTALGSQGPNQAVGSINLVFSKDLVTWTGAVKLLDVSFIWSHGCTPENRRVGYVSLVDLGSRDRNFMDVGDHPDLYMTVLPLTDCAATLDRRLVRYRLELDVAAPH